MRPYPIQSPSAWLTCTPFFIVSSGRSGSTLVRAILNQDRTICIPPESNVLGQVATRFTRYLRFLPWPHVVKQVVSTFQRQSPGFGFWDFDVQAFLSAARALPKEHRSLAKLLDAFYACYARHQKPRATRWGDKSIGNALCLPSIARIFPDARYVSITRDGRDVAVSLVEADTTSVTDVRSAAAHWQRSVTAVRRFLAQLEAERSLELRYEELVREPEMVVPRLYAFLGLGYGSHALEYWQNVDSLADASRDIHRNLRRPIHPDAIGRWRTKLTPNERTAVEAMLRPTLLDLDYTVD